MLEKTCRRKKVGERIKKFRFRRVFTMFSCCNAALNKCSIWVVYILELQSSNDAYGYNLRSEVVSSRRTLADSPVRGFDYDYAYDPIGNRTSATDYDEQGNALVLSYSANALNQYTHCTVPGYAVLRGEARELRQRRTAAIPYAPHIYSIRLICPPSSFNDIDFSESSSDTSRIVNAA